MFEVKVLLLNVYFIVILPYTIPSDHKESDAYISYHTGDCGKSEEDLNFVINVLKVKLESQGYKLVIRDVHHTPGKRKYFNNWYFYRQIHLVESP